MVNAEVMYLSECVCVCVCVIWLCICWL